ncbi:helix-turn-helix domain-containing protein [Kineosporia babensis]|uniref:Helix-turn-helix domain-containing protein n=1 Tax=Kineosporia babensis TaxID=499548 RepID=A0A9X1NAN7_9ACTN|nr:helix-turn-helix domain-containing protein [Kineosporia babensis]MCD5311467.1 helix-turn-helix domain-containing protein [Kineosporia babensis]
MVLSPGQQVLPPSRLTAEAGPESVLLVVLTGSAKVRASSATVKVGPGQALRIPPGTSHTIITAADTVALPIRLAAGLNEEDLPPDLRSTTDPVPSYVSPDWYLRLVHLFARNLGYLDLPEPTNAVPAGSLPRSPDAFAVARLLLENPTREDSPAALAARVGISERTLQRRFADETGLSFSTWRSRLRVQIAAQHLQEGRGVSWVAAQVGFRSASGFARAFREHQGTSAREFRRNSTSGSGASQVSVPQAVPPSQTWPRVNGSHVAVWMYRGSAEAVVGGRAFALTQGDALILPAGISTQVRVAADSLLLPLGFRSGGGAPLSVDSLTTTRFSAADENYLLHHLIATYTQLRPGGHRSTDVFDLVAARTTILPNLDPAADLAVRIARNPLEHGGLADFSGVDAQAFRAATGLDFANWRRQARLTLARELLLRGLPPSAVSRQVGYAHLSGFSRAFSAAYGISPRRFAAQIPPVPAHPARVS